MFEPIMYALVNSILLSLMLIYYGSLNKTDAMKDYILYHIFFAIYISFIGFTISQIITRLFL